MKKSGIAIFFTIITSIAFAQQKQNVFENSDFEVRSIEFINTIASDISPLFVRDSLYFSGIRKDYFNKNNREKKNKAFYDIYAAALNPDGILSSGRLLVPGFGNDWHEGPADFCEATGELFVTLSNIIDPDTLRKVFTIENIRLRIVIMKKMDGKWKITEEFPFNSDKYNFAHPAVTVTGDTLVFSSDMDSISFGNSDLFMSVRKNGKWFAPVNLGSFVNTAGEEVFPTFITGGILAFSNNSRKGNFGNLDIWYTDFPGFSYVRNAGNNINSVSDDFGLVINNNTGYFSSNRGGKGSDDIFQLEIKPRYTVINGKVINRLTNLPISNAHVSLKGCDNTLMNSIFTDAGGNFSFQVNTANCPSVEASKEGFTPDNKEITGLDFLELKLVPDKKYELLVLDIDTKKPIDGAEISGNSQKSTFTSMGIISLDKTIQQGDWLLIKRNGYLDQTLIIDTLKLAAVDTIWLYKKELNKTFVLDNIYYDFDKYDILPESEIEIKKLIKILNDNPDIKVELGSHTDSRGNDSYNLKLSQKRSESAVAFIIKSGIPKSRIAAKGYGETQLVNKCTNGVTCTDQEHRKNRRTEFKIIGF
jgi:outer membrane protein OmpA-like peptidoglycan-associated protein